MRLSCEIVEDLLPLYFDEVCSEKSREAVEEHLRACETCRQQLYGKELPYIPQIEPKREEQALKKSMVKIRHRWWLSIIAILMTFPLILLCILGVHERRGEGIAFSNLRELWECRGFMNALKAGDGEKAASYIDFSSYYEECREALAMTPEDFMPKITIVLSDDGQWVFIDSAYKDYDSMSELTDLWYAAVERNDQRIMIPAEVFQTIVGEQDTVALDGEGYRLSNGVCYLPYETERGTFMVHEDTWELLKAPDILLPDVVSNIPDELYRELTIPLSNRADLWYKDIQERLGQVADLDREAFCTYMKEWYGERLNKFVDQGFSIEKHSYSTAYTSTQGWNVVFHVTARENGEDNRLRFVFSLDKNKIYGLYATGTDDLSYGYDVLSPRFD